MSSAQSIQRDINYINNRIENDQEEIDIIYQSINTFKLPYKYFKKFNILPLNLVEGEIDKYFTIETLILENYSEAKHISSEMDYNLRYSRCKKLEESFMKYYNNIPYEFIKENNLLYKIISNHYTEYKQLKIINSEVDNNLQLKVRELIDNTINKHKQKINSNIEIISIKTEELRQLEQEKEAGKKYFLPINSWVSDMILKFPNEEDYYLDHIKIVKVCNKVVKYTNRYITDKVRQIKKTELQDKLNYSISKWKGYRLMTEDESNYYTYNLTNLSVRFEKIN